MDARPFFPCIGQDRLHAERLHAINGERIASLQSRLASVEHSAAMLGASGAL